MGELECFEVLATALPGRTLYIEQVMHTTKVTDGTDINHAVSLISFLSSSQAVGHCDGNDAQTELFQIYDVGPDGERANERRQYHFKNGTVVDV